MSRFTDLYNRLKFPSLNQPELHARATDLVEYCDRSNHLITQYVAELKDEVTQLTSTLDGIHAEVVRTAPTHQANYDWYVAHEEHQAKHAALQQQFDYLESQMEYNSQDVNGLLATLAPVRDQAKADLDAHTRTMPANYNESNAALAVLKNIAAPKIKERTQKQMIQTDLQHEITINPNRYNQIRISSADIQANTAAGQALTLADINGYNAILKGNVETLKDLQKSEELSFTAPQPAFQTHLHDLLNSVRTRSETYHYSGPAQLPQLDINEYNLKGERPGYLFRIQNNIQRVNENLAKLESLERLVEISAKAASSCEISYDEVTKNLTRELADLSSEFAQLPINHTIKTNNEITKATIMANALSEELKRIDAMKQGRLARLKEGAKSTFRQMRNSDHLIPTIAGNPNVANTVEKSLSTHITFDKNPKTGKCTSREIKGKDGKPLALSRRDIEQLVDWVNNPAALKAEIAELQKKNQKSDHDTRKLNWLQSLTTQNQFEGNLFTKVGVGITISDINEDRFQVDCHSRERKEPWTQLLQNYDEFIKTEQEFKSQNSATINATPGGNSAHIGAAPGTGPSAPPAPAPSITSTSADSTHSDDSTHPSSTISTNPGPEGEPDSEDESSIGFTPPPPTNPDASDDEEEPEPESPSTLTL